ncbi:MAG: hypothetical protein ACYDB2_05480 [Acidimicrobiales bacterium]
MDGKSRSGKYGSYKSIVGIAIVLDVALLAVLLIYGSRTGQWGILVLFLIIGSWLIPLFGHLIATHFRKFEEQTMEITSLKRAHILSLPAARSYGWVLSPDSGALLGEFYMNRNQDSASITFNRVTLYEDEGTRVDVMSYGDGDPQFIKTLSFASLKGPPRCQKHGTTSGPSQPAVLII